MLFNEVLKNTRNTVKSLQILKSESTGHGTTHKMENKHLLNCMNHDTARNASAMDTNTQLAVRINTMKQ